MPNQALLLSGGMSPYYNYPRYANDLGLAYACICPGRIAPANVTVLYADGRALTHNGLNITTGPADLDGIARFFARDADELFVYVTNHGDRTTIQLWGTSISVHDFAQLANRHAAPRRIFVFEQCYSGALLPLLERGGTLAISSCSANEPSHCSPNQLTDDFSLHFFSAANNMTVFDAFAVARAALSSPQTPQLADPSNIAQEVRISLAP